MKKKYLKVSKADLWAWAAMACTLVATTLFVVSLVFTAYAIEGFLAIPPVVLVVANAAAVAAIVLSLFALTKGASRKLSFTALVISLFVVSFPYLATIISM